MRPALQTRLVRRIWMHFVTGDAGELSTAKTGGCLRAIKLATGDTNHSIAPETVLKKFWFSLANKIFLLRVIGGVWLHDKLLREIVSTWAKPVAMPVKIDFVRHVLESPDTVALPARERRFGSVQF